MVMILLLLLIQSGWVGNAFSQISRLSVQIQLRKLEERLKFTEEVVLAYGGKESRAYLGTARELFRNAADAFQENRLLLANACIQKSLFYIELALRTTFSNSGKRMAEHLEELILRAERALINCHQREAEKMLISARENYDIGLKKLRQQEFERGLEHLRIANLLAEKVLKLCQGQAPNEKDTVQEEQARFGQLLERAQQSVESKPDQKATQLLEQALDLAQQADKAIRETRFNIALDHYYKATRLLWRVIELTRSSASTTPAKSDRIQREFEILDGTLQQLNEALNNDQNARARFLYQRALKLRHEAWAAYQAGRLAIAIKKMEMSQNAVTRARSFLLIKAAIPNEKEDARRELERLEQELEALKANEKVKSDAESQKFLEIADQHLTAAKNALAHQSPGLGLERMLIAQQFLHWAENLSAQENTTALTQTAIQSQMQLFDNLQEKQASLLISNKNQTAVELFSQAQSFRKQAATAFEQNQLFLAQATIETAHKLLQKSIELVNQ